MKQSMLLLLLCACVGSFVGAQSPAAMAKLAQKYDVAQLRDLQLQTHYKYESMLLYYAASFHIQELGQVRSPTEDEISRVNLDQYAAQRDERSAVTVYDATLGKNLILMSRQEFERLVLQHLSEFDAKAYQTYKASTQAASQKNID